MDDFEDAFDVPSYEPDEDGADPTILIPPKLLELCQKHGSNTVYVKCQRKTPADKSWKGIPGRWTIPEDETPDPEKMALAILDLASRHHRKNASPDTQYRGVCVVSASGGGQVERVSQFRADLNTSGELAWDDDDEWVEEKSELAVLREMVTRFEERDTRRDATYLKDRADLTSQFVAMTSAVTGLVGEIQGMATGMGEVVRESMFASKGVLEMHKDRDRGNVDIRKLDYEYKLRQEEILADQADRASARETRAQALEQLKVFAPFILKQAFKLDDDTFRLVMGVMAGGGGGAAPLALRASPDEQAAGQEWSPPAKPSPPAEDREESEWGPREKLSVWFHQLTDEQERGTRRIVGPELYDLIRDSASQSDDQAKYALKRFMDEVGKLGSENKSALVTNLLNVLGTWGPTFIGIAGEATGMNFQ